MFGLHHRAIAPTEADVQRLRAAAIADPTRETLGAFGRAAYFYELGTDASSAHRAGEAAVRHWTESGEVPSLRFVDRLSY